MTDVRGIDLSLTATGLASSLGWCTTVGCDGITALPLRERVLALHKLKAELLEAIGDPGLVCIETPALSKARGGVFERGWLWFAVVSALTARDIPVIGVGTGQLKKYATGDGQANKGKVMVAVTRRWPQFETGGDDNMADAAVPAAIGADLLGEPLAEMPATHRAALTKLDLPEGLAR